jgi:hypothetical protein
MGIKYKQNLLHQYKLVMVSSMYTEHAHDAVTTSIRIMHNTQLLQKKPHNFLEPAEDGRTE